MDTLQRRRTNLVVFPDVNKGGSFEIADVSAPIAAQDDREGAAVLRGL